MKRVIDEYLKTILYTIFGLVLVLSSYMIMINIHHYKSLSTKLTISEVDVDYVSYKDNINNIESYLNSYSGNKGTLTSLNKTLTVLKAGGVFRLIPNSKIEYHDLYELNDYFLNDIINNCWISDLKGLNNNKENEKIVNILIKNSEYLSNHFIDNGLTLYDSIGQDTLDDDYKMILNNYLSFSNVILSMSKS